MSTQQQMPQHLFFVDLIRNLTVLFLFPSSDEEIQLIDFYNHGTLPVWTNKLPTQYEWLVISKTATVKTIDTLGFNQSMLFTL